MAFSLLLAQSHPQRVDPWKAGMDCLPHHSDISIAAAKEHEHGLKKPEYLPDLDRRY